MVQVHILLYYYVGSVFSISLHPSGELACSGGEDDKARVWKVTDGTTSFVCEGNIFFFFWKLHTSLRHVSVQLKACKSME